MAIPASQIVQVNPRLLTPGGTDLEFNGLFLTESAALPPGAGVYPFANADEAGDFFGVNSPEYAAASVYFAGYNNSFKKPRAIYFARRVNAAQGASLVGAGFEGDSNTLLAGLQAVTDGALTLTVNGEAKSVTGVSLASATSLTAVAEAVAAAINGEESLVTGSWSGTNQNFTFSTVATGAEAAISFAADPAPVEGETGSATGLASLMLLTQDAGAMTTQGADAQTPAENMRAITEATKNFVTFTTLYKAEKDEVLALSAWASAQGVNYLYVFWDDDPALLTPQSGDTIAAALTAANAGATAGVYGSSVYAAFICGVAASIDWERTQGTITLAFKAQDGLAANVQTGTAALNLEKALMNYMGNWATRNDQFIFLYPGKMWGSWSWIDTYLNAVWLNNALQVAIMNGLSQSPRTPYNDQGYSLVRAWCLDPINRAINNGVIDSGVTLSEAQKAQIAVEAGNRDISGDLYANGYYLLVKDPAASVRVTRDSPECSLWYTYGGSIHRITLASTVLS